MKDNVKFPFFPSTSSSPLSIQARRKMKNANNLGPVNLLTRVFPLIELSVLVGSSGLSINGGFFFLLLFTYWTSYLNGFGQYFQLLFFVVFAITPDY